MEPVRESILRRPKKGEQHDPLHQDRNEEKEFKEEQDRLARLRHLREERTADILRRVNGKSSDEGASGYLAQVKPYIICVYIEKRQQREALSQQMRFKIESEERCKEEDRAEALLQLKKVEEELEVLPLVPFEHKLRSHCIGDGGDGEARTAAVERLHVGQSRVDAVS